MGARQEHQVGRARTAQDLQDHRIGEVLAADRDPLVDAADPHEPRLVDAVRAGDADLPGVRGALELPVAQQAGEGGGKGGDGGGDGDKHG
ncbi:hypothetical protein [Streptomyces sp. NPDC039016]|uniref:hypothetical protein n=1 Tax=Streptomyces sp. NPDC039016 TaxID=3154330 RepID=UPI0034039D0C